MKRESSTAEGTLLITWQLAVPMSSGESATKDPSADCTAGMRERLPEKMKKAQKRQQK